jgi:hypothetical protein
MVAIQDGVHDHGDGELCPGCQFKAVLAEHLEWAADEDDLTWHDLTGELIVLMGTARQTTPLWLRPVRSRGWAA